MNIESEKQKVYKAISEYFGNATFIKGEDTAPDRLGNRYSIYYSKIGCMLCVEDRYVVCIVHADDALEGNVERISNLRWVSIQTRTFETNPIPGMKTQNVNTIFNPILAQKATVVKKTDDRWVYDCGNLPIELHLMLDEDNNRYSETGSIKTCLDTYMCVVNFII
jgi:hypothetical protein